jgi:putative hydroxymethylpyrimidine transport system substrate-binding protein
MKPFVNPIHKEQPLTDQRRNRPHIIRFAPLALVLIVAGVVSSGCGEKSETVDASKIHADRVVLTLDWQANADHAGIYTGIANGDFTKEAIQVDPKVPSDPAAVIKTVAAGRSDLGISYENEVLAARDKGAKIKAIAAIVPTPLNSIIWLKKSGIKSIKGLKGKTIGVSGDGNSSSLNTILIHNGVEPKSVKQINVGYDLQSVLLSGKVDASMTGFWNVEGVQLKINGRPATVIPVNKEGVPTYDELVVIASEASLKDSRRVEIYRRFLAGLAGGTAAAVADPNAAYAALGAKAPDLISKTADKKFLKASLAVTLPVLAKKPDQPFGFMDPALWTTYGKWMHDNGLITGTNVNYADALTTDLLPGVGPTVETPENDDDTGSVNSQ